ncbi:MAG: nucleotide pyrophosphohydrolase [PVC group bacterium]|nr:nucleotide pyrophosphohydrolase [PVC group bacterium]
MSDSKTTIQQIKSIVKKFVNDRDWEQYQSPKNLSMALAVEGSELMEIYQWTTTDDSRSLHSDAKKNQDISDELADIAVYLFSLCNVLGVDLSEAVESKMKKNNEKYPVELSKGKPINSRII